VGKNVAGKILVYPESKGSTCAGMVIKTLANVKCQPKAIVTVKQPDYTSIQGIIDLPPKNRSSLNVRRRVRMGDFFLKDKVSEIYVIGDYVEPRKVLNAIWEGYRFARLI